MQLPYLSGSSLSSADTTSIFRFAPKAAVGGDRVQGSVAEITPSHSMYAAHTAHLPSWLVERSTSRGWRLWQRTWLSELRNLGGGYLFVFVTDYETDRYGKERTGSFKSKFESREHTEGGDDEREGEWKSAEEWCHAQDFDPSFGFNDEGWGFAAGTRAVSILDFERLHLQAVSRKNRLPTAFITLGYDRRTHSSAQQVEKPRWYPYEGIEAPLGTFVFDSKEQRLVPATGNEQRSRTSPKRAA
jgi:hypothetical protein